MLEKIFNPTIYLGNNKRKNYFEGWYFKQTDKDKSHIISFIPAISFSDGDEHSFIQYVYVDNTNINERKVKTGYIRFKVKDFSSQKDPFFVKIGSNKFSINDISIEIDEEDFKVSGIISFKNIVPIEKTLLMPNIMGIFAYMPKMECSHGIVSMLHDLSGKLEINGEQIDFAGGKGYIEKDWGTSFPKDYIWVQCNNFKKYNSGLMLSVANIPFMGTEFKGFLCNVNIEGREYRFATYNHSKVVKKEINSQGIFIVFENKKAKLSITAKVTDPGELIAPVKGSMVRKIKEEVTGFVSYKLEDKINNLTYEDDGEAAGIEIVNIKLGEN